MISAAPWGFYGRQQALAQLPGHLAATALVYRFSAAERHDQNAHVARRRTLRLCADHVSFLGTGKRGGLRVIYFWREAGQQFWLFTLYDKEKRAICRRFSEYRSDKA